MVKRYKALIALAVLVLVLGALLLFADPTAFARWIVSW